MEKGFRRTQQCNIFGGILGTAIGIPITTDTNVAKGPIGVSAIVALAVSSAADSAFAGAIGTLINGEVEIKD